MRHWLWGVLAVGGLGLFFSFSRSAWLGTACGLLYLAWAKRPWRAVDWRVPRVQRMAVLFGGLLLVVAIVLGVLFRELLVTRFLRLGEPLEATSIRERIEEAQQAWSLIRVVPLKGVGSTYYVDALWAGVGEDRPPAFRTVHNTYLLAAAELGVGGALLWLGVVLAPSIACARRVRHAVGAAQLNGAGVGLAAAFLAAAILSAFDSYLYMPSNWWSALYLGLLSGAWARGAGTRQHREIGGRLGPKVGGARDE
jgi:O-antigen ligase